MALLGSAAMVLTFDIDPEAADEHDDWHTREHLPERLSIPGFRRGSRWKAEQARSYLVLYEVADLDVLVSPAYLERLNNPTPWTRKMMQSYRGMRRGFCRVAASAGAGLGGAALLLRFSPAPQRDDELRAWLREKMLPDLAATPGNASAHLLHAAGSPPMTSEQQIRGRDAGFDWVLLATGYRVQRNIDAAAFTAHGALEAPQPATYRLECLLAAKDSGPARTGPESERHLSA